MKKLGCLIVLCCLLTGAGLVWSLPPITSSSMRTAPDNETIRSVATQLVTGGTLPSVSVTGGITASSYSATRMADDNVSNNHPQCISLFEDADDGDSVFKHCAGPLDGNATVTAVGSGINFGTLNLITTGTIQGDINVVDKSDNATLATTEMRGSLVVVSAAKTMTLPAVETGNSACVYSSGANVVEVRPNANDGFVLAGAARDTDGQGIYSDGTAGAFVCFFGDSADGWTTLGSKGTWTSR